MKKTLLKYILYGSLTITIPDVKDAKVVAAKDLYNTRTGQSLTLLQYAKEILRLGVVNEFVIQAQQSAQATATSSDATNKAAQVAAQTIVQTTINTEGSNW